MRLTLAITTYERPDALAAVLETVAHQTRPPEELIVADDGSGEATRAAIRRFAARAPYPVRHVRQEHRGFRLARLRNLAIAGACGDYLVFVDGDMLLDRRFLADHAAHARPGSFVQGVRVPLDARATAQRLAPGEARLGAPAVGLGPRRLYTLHDPALSRIFAAAANCLVSIKGCNQAFWRADLVAVNGFDEDLVGWGPEDKELCARLVHLGVRRRTLLFGAIAYHLHHPPASREDRTRNEAILAQTRRARRVRAAHGLDARAAENPDNTRPDTPDEARS